MPQRQPRPSAHVRVCPQPDKGGRVSCARVRKGAPVAKAMGCASATALVRYCELWVGVAGSPGKCRFVIPALFALMAGFGPVCQPWARETAGQEVT
jgi:hypothetical protein